jgi:hypothetical protein
MSDGCKAHNIITAERHVMVLPRVVQREGLTVQRHRHTFDGSCYGVTALFHGVTRC